MTNKIPIQLPDVSCDKLGITPRPIVVDTYKQCLSAITKFSGAIGKVSEERSRMGAYQNRLESTIRNLDNVTENTTASESRLRDTDMAKELVSYSRDNILAQAGQAMIAQANFQNQGVLALLQ